MSTETWVQIVVIAYGLIAATLGVVVGYLLWRPE